MENKNSNLEGSDRNSIVVHRIVHPTFLYSPMESKAPSEGARKLVASAMLRETALSHGLITKDKNINHLDKPLRETLDATYHSKLLTVNAVMLSFFHEKYA